MAMWVWESILDLVFTTLILTIIHRRFTTRRNPSSFNSKRRSILSKLHNRPHHLRLKYQVIGTIARRLKRITLTPKIAQNLGNEYHPYLLQHRIADHEKIRHFFIHTLGHRGLYHRACGTKCFGVTGLGENV
jgi:hypothetical protein